MRVLQELVQFKSCSCELVFLWNVNNQNLTTWTKLLFGKARNVWGAGLVLLENGREGRGARGKEKFVGNEKRGMERRRKQLTSAESTTNLGEAAPQTLFASGSRSTEKGSEVARHAARTLWHRRRCSTSPTLNGTLVGLVPELRVSNAGMYAVQS